MTLTYSLQSAMDLRNKLCRDVMSLEEEVTGDRFFNVVVTGYHLAEWIRRDPLSDEDVKSRLVEVQGHLILRVCADLANASKHFLQRGKDAIKKAESEQGFGLGRFGKGPFGIGEESIQLTLDDRTILDALDFSHQLSSLYDYVFEG